MKASYEIKDEISNNLQSFKNDKIIVSSRNNIVILDK
jgi:hypothetical protein